MPGAGRPDEEDVRLLELDVLGAGARLPGPLRPRGLPRVDALVVVVDGDREDLLRLVLPDHVVVEEALDLGRGRQRHRRAALVALGLLRDDVVAEPDALVADVDRRPRDELADLALPLPAEGTREVSVVVLFPAHAILVRRMLPPNRSPGIPRPDPQHNQRRSRIAPATASARTGRFTRRGRAPRYPPRGPRRAAPGPPGPRDPPRTRRRAGGRAPRAARAARPCAAPAARGGGPKRSASLRVMAAGVGGALEHLVPQLAPARLGEAPRGLRPGEHLDHLERRRLPVPPARARAPARAAPGTRSSR